MMASFLVHPKDVDTVVGLLNAGQLTIPDSALPMQIKCSEFVARIMPQHRFVEYEPTDSWLFRLGAMQGRFVWVFDEKAINSQRVAEHLLITEPPQEPTDGR